MATRITSIFFIEPVGTFRLYHGRASHFNGPLYTTVFQRQRKTAVGKSGGPDAGKDIWRRGCHRCHDAPYPPRAYAGDRGGNSAAFGNLIAIRGVRHTPPGFFSRQLHPGGHSGQCRQPCPAEPTNATCMEFRCEDDIFVQSKEIDRERHCRSAGRPKTFTS